MTNLYRLLSAAGLILLLCSIPASAQITINGSGSYSDLQSAVTAASPGDVIGFPAGTYVHGSDVSINKAGLTIEGAGSGSTIVQVSGTGYRFSVAAAGVTIRNMTIEKTDKAGVQNIIWVNASDFTLQNTVMRGQFVIGDGDVSRAIVVSGGHSGILFDNNEFYALRQPAYVTGTTTGSVTANYTHGTKGWVLEGGNLTFTGNSWGTGPDVNVYDIAILSTMPPGFYTDIVAMSNANDGAVIEDQRVSPAVLSAVYVQAGTSYTTDLGGRYHPYAAITPAITRVVAGGSIHVSAGTFEEQLEITKNLSILGDGAGSTVIRSPLTLTKYYASSANNYPVVYIHDAAAVTVRDLTVDGAGRGNANYRFQGIGFSNAGGTIEECEIKDVRDTPFSGSQHGVAIGSYNNDGVARTITVRNNTIAGFQKNAMALNAGPTTALAVAVEGNTITGAGPTSVTAQNGIQVYADAGSGTVDGNTVTGIGYTGSGWVATSILNFFADIDITDNVVSNGHVGIYNIDGAGTISGNDFTIEKMGGYGYGIIATDPPEAVPSPFDEPPSSPSKSSPYAASGTAATLVVSITGNEVTFSGGDNTGTYGIEADAGYGTDDIAFTASNNLVTGFGTGIGVYECTSGCSPGVFTAASLSGNGLNGNTIAVESNVSYLTVDASGNWLGASTTAGAAAAVSGDVDYTPWLASGTDTDPAAGFQGDFSTLWVDDDSPQSGSGGRIQEGISMVTGSTVNVAAGAYVEGPQVVIDRDVDVVGAGKLLVTVTPSANTGSSGDARGWWLVQPGYTFNLSGMTLDGTGRLVFMGILHKGSGTISYCRFINMKYNESSAYMGMAMSARETPNMNVDVYDSEFSGMGRIGLHYRGPGLTGTISGCTFTGKGPGNWLDYGIEAGGAPLPEGGAKLTIENCTITDCEGVAASDGSTSAGILVTTYFGPGTEATVTGCTLTGNTDGIAVGYDAADASVVVASNNEISGNSEHGIHSTNPYVDARNNYWGTLHGPADAVGTVEVPKMPAPSVGDALNALPAPGLGNAVTENVDYWPWIGPATGHAGGGIWATGTVNPTANDIFMGFDAGASDGVDVMDTVAPPPPPSDYLYLYFLLAPGSPIENYSVDIKKDEASLAAAAKAWDLRALTDHTGETVDLTFLLSGLPSGFHPTLYDLASGNYKDLSGDPTYSYTSPAGITPSPFRILIGDSTAPTVEVSAPNGAEYLVVGTPYNLTWSSSDGSGVLRNYVYYSGTGSAPYTLIDSVDGGTTTYAWTPASATTTASIKVVARDSVMNEAADVSDATFTVLASSTVSYGAGAGWNLVSVPMLQASMTPAAVFGDDYGATPYYTFGFSPTLGYSIPAALTMGQGYWLGSNSAQVIDATGTPLSSASLALASGFNIIGNPFASDLDVADLAFTDGVDTHDIAGAATAGWLSNVLYGYDGSGYYLESSALEVWKGYWVPMLAPGISVVYTPTVAVPTPKTVPVAGTIDNDAWSVELTAEFGNSRDRIAAFGVRSDAADGFSPRYDAPRPPTAPTDRFVEVAFLDPDDADARYARKYLPAGSAGWDLLVTTSGPGQVTLRWDITAIAGTSEPVVLYDRGSGLTVDMKASSSCTFTMEGTTRRLSVNRPAENTDAAIPASWLLAQNYPNPFNPATTIAFGLPKAAAVSIEVFNFLGQRVAVLSSPDVLRPAGYHEVVFDAASLASGLYYYTLSATAEDGFVWTDVRKMLLVR